MWLVHRISIGMHQAGFDWCRAAPFSDKFLPISARINQEEVTFITSPVLSSEYLSPRCRRRDITAAIELSPVKKSREFNQIDRGSLWVFAGIPATLQSRGH